jgi:hypothetical protein
VVAPGDLLLELEGRLAAPSPTLRAGRKRRRRFGAVGAISGAALMAIVMVLPALAVHGTPIPNLFELEGNAVNDASNPRDDWSLLDDGATDPNNDDSALASRFIGASSEAPAPDTTYFAGGGSKDDLQIQGNWKYDVTGSAQDKAEILDAFAAAYEHDGDNLIYFGADRQSADGDTFIGFWFLQGQLAFGAPANNGVGAINGTHTVGDTLVISDFTNGGSVAAVKVYQWVGSGGDTNGTLDLVFSNIPPEVVDCGQLVLTVQDDVCATVNPAGGEVAPWPFTPKANQGPPGFFPKGTFYEGGLNLTELIPGFPGCFSSFLAETRASQSVDSTLSDFAYGTLDTCNPEMTVTKTPSVTDVCAGSSTSVTYTYVVTNTGNTDLTNIDVSDDKIAGAQAAFEAANGGSDDLAKGAAAVTFTLTGPVNATTTNTITVDGDSLAGANTASATASATVTGHDCTISLTKTPDIADVCNGSSTTVTYTYTVTNNSDFFSVSGSIVDDQVASVPNFGPIAPGGSASVTATDTVSGTITNNATATGTFTDADSSTATATATATVTGHVCTISVTKTPSATNVCNGSTVDYDYTVTNNSDLFDWTGDVVDDAGTPGVPGDDVILANDATILAGATANYSQDDVTISGTVTNIVSASGAFNDPASTAASNTATATVTGHLCTISLTKTPSATDVCDGATVTYTYVLTNNNIVDTWTGTLTDDQLGLIDGSIILGPGASETFTASGAISGTVTNIATASGMFDDPASTAASTTANAAVTAHDCTISITKSPSAGDVCNGKNTQITYTYVVTNDSDFFSVSGLVSDDQFGSIGSFGPLAPGASKTLTKIATVNATVTNIATATGTFDDPDATSDSDTATATVTGHVCTISVTKHADADTVCRGESTTYDFTVHNNSDQFTWSGSVVDNVVGTIDASLTLAPGGTATYNNVAGPPLNANSTNTVTASGAFNDPASSQASATASDTVNVQDCGGNLFHTGTTCRQYLGIDPPSGLAGQQITEVLYSVKANKINSISPGVFFYYTTVQGNGGSLQVVINQIPPASYNHPFGIQQNNQVRVFNANCNTYSNFTFNVANGDATVTINNTTNNADYIISVKYDTGSLKGLTPPATSPVKYNFQTEIGGNVVDQDDDGLNLTRK